MSVFSCSLRQVIFRNPVITITVGGDIAACVAKGFRSSTKEEESARTKQTWPPTQTVRRACNQYFRSGKWILRWKQVTVRKR